MLDIVTFSTLYPNQVRPHHGIFVEQRLRHLVETGEVRSRVIAPVPWFPFTSARFDRYAHFARVPRKETRYDIPVAHPRYLVLPKIGMTVAPSLLAWASRPAFLRLQSEGCEYKAIDAHYFYPDGVAAVRIGQWLGKPVVITARGTDINLIPDYHMARRQILWAARRCAAIITVCQALKDRLVELGVPAERITVLRNGVDLDFFRPMERKQVREQLGFRGKTLLSVGILSERKGHDIAIAALPHLEEDVRLVIVGDGDARVAGDLRKLVQDLDLGERVTFVPPVKQDELRRYYSAADALVLASSREGMANVLLESLACGTPVIAARSWGTPEVVSDPAAGILMERRDPESLAEAFRRLIRNYPSREATRRFAERFDWKPTTDGQVEIFSCL